MARIKGKGLFKVGNGRSDLIHAEIGTRTGMVAFGHVGRMIRQRGQMCHSGFEIAPLQRVTPALEQQIHRRRAGLAPLQTDFTLDPGRFGLGRADKPVIERIQTGTGRGHALPQHGYGKRDYRDECRDDTFEIMKEHAHNI